MSLVDEKQFFMKKKWKFTKKIVQHNDMNSIYSTHLVRNSTVSRPEIEDDRVLGDGMGPVETGQKSVVGRLGGLVDGIGRLSENSVVNVKATAAHDVLVKDAGVLFIVCIQYIQFNSIRFNSIKSTFIPI